MSHNAELIEAQATPELVARIAQMPTSQLCEVWGQLYTNDRRNYTDEAVIVRRQIQNELEARDPNAFDLWLLSDDPADTVNPARYFCK